MWACWAGVVKRGGYALFKICPCFSTGEIYEWDSQPLMVVVVVCVLYVCLCVYLASSGGANIFCRSPVSLILSLFSPFLWGENITPELKAFASKSQRTISPKNEMQMEIWVKFYRPQNTSWASQNKTAEVDEEGNNTWDPKRILKMLFTPLISRYSEGFSFIKKSVRSSNLSLFPIVLFKKHF